MSSLLDRIAQGDVAMTQGDHDVWHQQIGSAPPDRFQQAATDAVRHLHRDHYAEHFQPDQNGTTPLHRVREPQRSTLAAALLSGLMNRGVAQNEIREQVGLSSLDPRQMSPEDIGALLQWVQQRHPEVLGQASLPYQDKPSLLHSILGNRALVSLALGLGAQILAGQLGANTNGPSMGSSGGGLHHERS